MALVAVDHPLVGEERGILAPTLKFTERKGTEPEGYPFTGILRGTTDKAELNNSEAERPDARPENRCRTEAGRLDSPSAAFSRSLLFH